MVFPDAVFSHHKHKLVTFRITSRGLAWATVRLTKGVSHNGRAVPQPTEYEKQLLDTLPTVADLQRHGVIRVRYILDTSNRPLLTVEHAEGHSQQITFTESLSEPDSLFASFCFLPQPS